MARYGMNAARRKYELIDPSSYTVIKYNEANTIVVQWVALANDVQIVYGKLGSGAQPTFHELVLHPVLAGSTGMQTYAGAAKNPYYAQQKRNLAGTVAANPLRLIEAT